MNLLFKIIDFFYQKKKNLFLKKTISKDIDIFIDVGAHYGDTINELLTIFSIKKITATINIIAKKIWISIFAIELPIPCCRLYLSCI